MTVQLSMKDLPQLLSWLEQYFPHTLLLDRGLRTYLKDLFPDLEFYVDEWPHPQAILTKANPNTEQLASRDYYQHVFGVDDEALSRLMKTPGVMDWDERTYFCGVSDHLCQLLQSVAEEMEQPADFSCYLLLRATPQDLTPRPLPEGMEVMAVPRTVIKTVVSTWDFVTEATEAYAQELIDRYPSVCLLTKNGHQVGHMLGTNHGTLGKLYVNPQFRGKGFAKVIVSQLAQKYFDSGEDAAYVIVSEENTASLHLHQSLGFRIVPEVKMVWMQGGKLDRNSQQ